MTEPRPVRVTEYQCITEPGRTIESARVVEFADHEPPGPPAIAGPRRYDPERDSPLAGTGMRLCAATDGPRAALPPGRLAPARSWWLRWWRR